MEMQMPEAVTVVEKASLYVGDLDQKVTEEQLTEVFSAVGALASVRVCRDLVRGQSLGYGYVNFMNHHDAANALERLNFIPINGRPMRIMYSNRDPTLRKSGYANVFIKNLDSSIDNKALLDTFSTLGTILSCKVATDLNGQSKGYGFVQFETAEMAQNAISQLNGMCLNDKQVYVGLFIRRQERLGANGSPKFTNIYVKNLSETVGDEELKQMFGPFGEITSAVVMREGEKSKGFGFVNFKNPDSAVDAVEKMHETTHDDKVLYVGRAQRKADRDAELKAKYEQEKLMRYEKMQGANLYVKNIDESIDDEKLREVFSEFGTITSVKIMLDQRGLSRGSGFVAFSSPEEASKAIKGLNGKMVARKPLYVAVAQRKEQRRAQLEAQFSQMRAPSPMGIPGFHPGAPRLVPHPLYFGQRSPGILPPAPGFSFRPPMLPGARPPPSFMFPYNLQRQAPGQRIPIRRGINFQQPPLLHRNTNQGARYMVNGMNASMLRQGPPGGPVQHPERVPIGELTSILASASVDKQRQTLGEWLFPMVERLQPGYTAKVTGMLLEMDQTEVLHLIESPEALKDKVAEAMEVLRRTEAAS